MIVNETVRRYADSINGDQPNLDLARQVWTTDDKTSFIHPPGHERGWNAIERNFYRATMGELLTDRKLVPYDIGVRELETWPWSSSIGASARSFDRMGRHC